METFLSEQCGSACASKLLVLLTTGNIFEDWCKMVKNKVWLQIHATVSAAACHGIVWFPNPLAATSLTSSEMGTLSSHGRTRLHSRRPIAQCVVNHPAPCLQIIVHNRCVVIGAICAMSFLQIFLSASPVQCSESPTNCAVGSKQNPHGGLEQHSKTRVTKFYC